MLGGMHSFCAPYSALGPYLPRSRPMATRTIRLLLLLVAFGLLGTACSRGEHCGCQEEETPRVDSSGHPIGALIPPRDAPIEPPSTIKADTTAKTDASAAPCLDDSPCNLDGVVAREVADDTQ